MADEGPGFDESTYDAARVYDVLEGAIREPGKVVLVSDPGGGQAVGALIAYVMPEWWSGVLEAYELATFVLPGARGGTHAARLIRAYVDWAREQGAERAFLAVSSGRREESVGRLYQRLGFAPVGMGYGRALL